MQAMKSYVKISGDTIRELRKGEIKVRDAIRKDKAHNEYIMYEVERITGMIPNWPVDDYSVADGQRQMLYRDRQTMKGLARYINLAYAYVRGLEYRQVENYTREGNRPDAQEVWQMLDSFHISGIDIQDIQDWMENKESS